MSKIRSLWVRLNPFITTNNIMKVFRIQAERLNEIADVQEEHAENLQQQAVVATNEAVAARRSATKLEELLK